MVVDVTLSCKIMTYIMIAIILSHAVVLYLLIHLVSDHIDRIRGPALAGDTEAQAQAHAY